MLDVARDVVGQVAAVAFWTSATTGAVALLGFEALLVGGWAGLLLAALMPVAAWGGGSFRRQAMLAPVRTVPVRAESDRAVAADGGLATA